MTDNLKPPFDVLVNPEGTEAIIRLAQNELRVSAAELENAIAWLGLLRSKMNPPVAGSLPESLQFLPLSNFVFLQPASSDPPTIGGVALNVRSAYFGWFQFQMSAEHCKHLVAWLSGQPVGAPRGATLN
jgi:hypothetical protein